MLRNDFNILKYGSVNVETDLLVKLCLRMRIHDQVMKFTQ